jgi:flagellar motor switch protein FliN/FliY
MDGMDMLSQDEINALLNGVSPEEEQPDSAGGDEQRQSLSDNEKDALGEIANISMGTAATTLSTLVNQRVVITTPVVSYGTLSELSGLYDRPCVFISLSYTVGLDGNNVLILKEADVKIITDLMMGGDGTNTADELSELHLSAIGEAMNQMMGSAATSLSSMLEKKVDISPPKASLIDLNDSIVEEELSEFLKEDFVVVSFRMEIGDLVDSQIMQLYPFDFARDLFKKFSGEDSGDQPAPQAAAPQPAPAPAPQAAAPQPAPAPMPQAQPQQPMMQAQPQPMMQQPMMQPQQQMGYQMPYMQPVMGDVNVQPAQFQPFNPGINPLAQTENIDLIMDVPLEITVELGRTNKSIKEILDFAPGTIIELNKLAGEPVDVLVNGKFVAKGEVVVIEENFGIRVTEVVH